MAVVINEFDVAAEPPPAPGAPPAAAPPPPEPDPRALEHALRRRAERCLRVRAH